MVLANKLVALPNNSTTTLAHFSGQSTRYARSRRVNCSPRPDLAQRNCRYLKSLRICHTIGGTNGLRVSRSLRLLTSLGRNLNILV
jgi:hypothetical protein